MRPRNFIGLLLLAALVASWWESGGAGRSAPAVPVATPAASTLPAEVAATLALIQQGGPFPYRKDGTVFQNREGELPRRERGYYREFTVPTPGETDRGARRIVSGGEPPTEFWYTADHYRSFRRLDRDGTLLD
jgi:ribonuclease T1